MRKLKINKKQRIMMIAAAVFFVILIGVLLFLPKEEKTSTKKGIAILKEMESQDVTKIEDEISMLDKISEDDEDAADE